MKVADNTGLPSGRPPTHGRYTKAVIASRREVRAILRALRRAFAKVASENTTRDELAAGAKLADVFARHRVL